MEAETAALTGDRVNLEIFNGVKTTKILAQVTAGTFFFINKGNLSTPELVLLLDNRLKQKMKVGGIHITVSQCLTLSHSGEGTYYAGLSSSSFTA